VDDTQRLSELTGTVYDAALDPGLWPSAIEQIARYVPGAFVNLFSQDLAGTSAQAFYTFGIPPDFLERYFQKYVGLNPMFPSTLFFDVGRVLTEANILPRAQLEQTTFYREWVRPLGWIDSMASVLEKSATSVAVIAVGRSSREGTVDDDAIQRMQLIVPHVRRALLIGKVIDLRTAEASSLADALDGIATGLLLVDATGRIVHTNAAGLAMLDAGAVVRAASGKFATVDRQADHALHDLFANAEAGDDAIGVAGIAVPLAARDGERYVAHVLPLTAGARKRASATYSAVAAVFVRKAAFDGPHPLEAIAAAFKLTPAEMRVLMMVVQVGGVPEIAPALGVSETTVKTHLAHIFAKTGTARQADLVKLVAGYMSPLA
jgi:DNA-binding CsgD family transcriptional regulator/PAS domain-containing protein